MVQETYALAGRVLATDIPSTVNFVRSEVGIQLRQVALDYRVTDPEMLQLLRNLYFGLVDTVIRLYDELLTEGGSVHDAALEAVNLTDSGRRLKVRGFRRALERLFSATPSEHHRWAKNAFEWANIILGSLRGVPIVGRIADPIKELKDSVETQAEDDHS